MAKTKEKPVTKKTAPGKKTKSTGGEIVVWPEEVLDAMKTVTSKYGANSLIVGSELAQSHTQRYPFDVFALDAAVGGGVPRGRVTLIIGAFSSLKTTLCLRAAGSAQKLCRYCHTKMKYTVNPATKAKPYPTISLIDPCECGKNMPCKVVFMDVEGSLDLDYARKLGFIPEIALYISPDYAEQGIDVMDAMVRSGQCDLVIIDSIAALTPTTEIEESAEKWQQGLGARLVNKMCRKLGSALNSLGPKEMLKPAIVFINQKRDKIGVMYGDPTTIPYGKGQEFIAGLTLDLRPGQQLKMDESGRLMKDKGEVVGQTVHWKVKKNKVSGGSGRSGEFNYFTLTSKKFGIKLGMVNNDEQILGYAKVLGIVDVGHGGNYAYGDIRGKGEPGFIRNLKDAKQWGQVKKDVRQAITNTTAVTEGTDE